MWYDDQNWFKQNKTIFSFLAIRLKPLQLNDQHAQLIWNREVDIRYRQVTQRKKEKSKKKKIVKIMENIYRNWKTIDMETNKKNNNYSSDVFCYGKDSSNNQQNKIFIQYDSINYDILCD